MSKSQFPQLLQMIHTCGKAQLGPVAGWKCNHVSHSMLHSEQHSLYTEQSLHNTQAVHGAIITQHSQAVRRAIISQQFMPCAMHRLHEMLSQVPIMAV